MSHTVVLTEDLREQRAENSINRAVRHCRIGKVTPKAPVFVPGVPFKGLPVFQWPTQKLPLPNTHTIPWAPNTSDAAWWQNPVISTC